VLLLFDIDGTLLLKATREHREALHEALRVVHGIDVPEADFQAAGRTDPAICRRLLVLAGVPSERFDDRVDELRDAACEAFARLCPADLSATVAPGMPEALEELRGAGHDLGLLSGNLEPIARLKLRRAGLATFFEARNSAFGSDHEDRAALPEVARRRAGKAHGAGGAVSRQQTVVIGDTPLDIQCARADGVRCIAIATGPFGAAELREADAVVERAADLPAAIAAL
jgi:phosphoglycolate phosphatase-like HAD superfamily hydrolase